MRRLAGNDPEVNEEWNCDKGRFGFMSARVGDRLTGPLVRDEESGEMRRASWPEAFAVAAKGLAAAGAAVGVLPGGRLTAEDAYAYSRFARAVLGTNNIDFRSRALSDEEADFLAVHVATRQGPTYADLEHANAVVLVGFEPEDESPIVFLRLRKAVREHGTRVYSIASHSSNGLAKLGGRLLAATPGDEATVVSAVATDAEVALDSGRRDPRRRADGDVARCADRRCGAGRGHRCQARLGPAACGRAWSARGRGAARPAARRASARPGRRPGRRRGRLGRRRAALGGRSERDADARSRGGR